MRELSKPSRARAMWACMAALLLTAMALISGCAVPTEVLPVTPIQPAIMATPTEEPVVEAKPTPAALQFPLPVPTSAQAGAEAVAFPIGAQFSTDRVSAALDFPLPPPDTVAVAAAPADDSGCITCHTSEDVLKQLAKEPEESGESLSEGEG